MSTTFGLILNSSPKEQDNIGQCFATYGAVLCHLNAARNHELSLVQRINTILLTEGKAKSQVKCPV